ncbi:MAG: TolC family protein [Bacteroidetes bacterium]|nr:TolC family protein [Bacteroidota bacterium]
MQKIISTLIFLLSSSLAFSQADTARILTYESFMDIVREHHPVARQADLQLVMGEGKLMKARGSFDPKLYNNLGQKYFEGKEYFSLLDAGLKVPTWFGIELKAGMEQNRGIYLDPENSTPSSGLWYAGISLPVGQGLFIDKRRAELQKAKIYQRSTEVERRLILNELLYEAGKAYWEFFKAYNQLRVYQNALELTRVRFQAVSQGAKLGDRAPIDTLEAGIQLQNRQLSLQQAELDFTNSRAMLSVFLWAEGTVPLEIPEETYPPESEALDALEIEPQFILQLEEFTRAHPNLQQYQYKLEQLVVDQRLKREQLKPVINLQYNPLTQVTNESPLNNYNLNNYKWGIEFGFPVFLRKERGDLKLAEAKIQETRWEMDNKREVIFNKIQMALNEWNTTKNQFDLYQQTVRDYALLLAGERQKFDIGESSLFLVNSREVSYIQAQIKLIDIQTKNRKADLTSRYALGIL